MTPESQVCSLELSKRLKELGVPQDSLFYWENTDLGEWAINSKDSINSGEFTAVSAFTVGELGEIIPLVTTSVKVSEKSWKCCITNDGTNGYFFGSTEANARAKCLIHLIEHNLIKIS